MPKAVLLVVALGGLLAAGVVEGLRTNRWGANQDAQAAADRLQAVPADFGSWKSVEVPMAADVLKVADAVGHVSRRYMNPATKEAVTVLLLSGPSGPIGAHTPDVCYAGTGYEMKGLPRKWTIPAADGGEPSSYWSARFEKPAPAVDPPLEVCWAWGVDGTWKAADNPRREFVLSNTLYKLYATRTVPVAERAARPTADKAAADPVGNFLKAFLPEVRRAIAPPAG